MTSPGEFYASLPPISKTWGTSLVVFSALTTFKLLSPLWLILDLPLVFSKFQVWRLLSCFLWAGNFGFPLVFDLLMIIQCAVKLEKDVYEGRPADFLFVLIFGMFVMLPCTLIPVFSLPILSKSLVTMTVYVWSRKYPNQNVSIMGLLQVPAFYFPWILVGMTLLMGGNVWVDLLGCVTGHLFYFLDEVYPLTSGVSILTTPPWVQWLVYQWAQNAPQMFPDAARLNPNVQRIYLRPPSQAPGTQGGGGAPSMGGAGGAPRAGGGAGSAGTGGTAAPAPAFRGRAYRLDRD